jgi:hypothetical protein
MSFGAIIATSDDNALLSAALTDCLIEVRVEQSLDEPTRFGLRVREDFSAGEPMAASAPELKKERVVTIAVQSNGGIIGLVRGPITDSQSQFTLGGPGSWFEVHGGDRRIELSRQCFQHAWEGRASDAARQIISGHGFDPDVQDTDHNYTRATQTLNQRGTDLDFLKTIARENGFFFWISLGVQLQGFGLGSTSLQVAETGHFKTSPFRALGPGGVPPSVSAIKLVPDATPTIRAGAGGDCGNNVTSFQAHEDVERPNTANITAVDDKSLDSPSTTASDPQSALANNGKTLTDVTGLQRSLCVTGAGNAEDVRNRAQAALADTGWYITANASTTVHMLGGVLQPHDVVAVAAVGSRYSGPFRVRKVTHVITPADHFMDIELQSNANLEK